MTKKKMKLVAKKAVKKLAEPAKKPKKVEFYSRLWPKTKMKVERVKELKGYRSLCEATESMLSAMCDELLAGCKMPKTKKKKAA